MKCWPGIAGGLIFLITVDTEGDDLWSKPRAVSTRNAAYLPRFHELCVRYGLKPTYLTNWEMVKSQEFREFGNHVIRTCTGEVGMHLHAWNSPPEYLLTSDDQFYQPYLIEYPEAVVRDKVKCLTAELEDAFSVKMVSHRAGRWSLDGTYAKILVENGYRVDCSVTPGISWRLTKGVPWGPGGTDYSEFPTIPYFVDPNCINTCGQSTLLEVPVTIMCRPSFELGSLIKHFRFGQRLMHRFFPDKVWLRPNGHNIHNLAWILQEAVKMKCACIEFMIHSSELMPGGSPYFRSQRSVDSLYCDMEALFALARDHFKGETLAEFRARFG